VHKRLLCENEEKPLQGSQKQFDWKLQRSRVREKRYLISGPVASVVASRVTSTKRCLSRVKTNSVSGLQQCVAFIRKMLYQPLECSIATALLAL